jgi:DNA-binding IclR family transcriptional regulator
VTTETPGGEKRLLSGTQTARRALALLRAIVESDRTLTLAEAAAAIGVNRSKAYRLLRELEEQALVQPVGDERRFGPGTGLVALAAKVISGVDLRSAARPFMERISEVTNETVSLHVRDRRYRVCVEVLEGRLPVRQFVPLGERSPLYAGTASKVIIAYLSDTEQEAILAWGADEGESVIRIREQLRYVKANGYLFAIGDILEGVAALSAPIFDVSGVLGSVCVSGPADRWNDALVDEAVPVLLQAARQLSHVVGNPRAATG